MGRKAKFNDEVAVSGPGRKARKQKDPVFQKDQTGNVYITSHSLLM